MYTDAVKKHFIEPHNFGDEKDLQGEGIIGVGEIGNMKCGDVMRLAILVDPRSHIIKDIKFKTFGCAAAIATSSIVTDLAKGKVIEEAEKISDEEVVRELGGLPKLKLHCSILASSALKKAIKDYREKNKTANQAW